MKIYKAIEVNDVKLYVTIHLDSQQAPTVKMTWLQGPADAIGTVQKTGETTDMEEIRQSISPLIVAQLRNIADSLVKKQKR